MIVAADILDFLTVFIPVAFLAQLAFRIGPAHGRSRVGTVLFVGGSIIGFSYVFKIYFDSVFGSVDAFWLFIFALGACVGLILALIGTNSIHTFIVSARSGEGRAATKAAKISVVVAVAFLIAFLPYFITFDRPVYWRFGALCYIINQVTLFGLGILVGEFFHSVDKPSAFSTAKFARVLAVYYLAEPTVWLTITRFSGGGHPSQVARMFINLSGV